MSVAMIGSPASQTPLPSRSLISATVTPGMPGSRPRPCRPGCRCGWRPATPCRRCCRRRPCGCVAKVGVQEHIAGASTIGVVVLLSHGVPNVRVAGLGVAGRRALGRPAPRTPRLPGHRRCSCRCRRWSVGCGPESSCGADTGRRGRGDQSWTVTLARCRSPSRSWMPSPSASIHTRSPMAPVPVLLLVSVVRAPVVTEVGGHVFAAGR